SLDYHTNMTPAMVEHATAMVGYRTYPHIDMADTGGKAAELLDRLLRDKRVLHKAFRQIDFLIPLVWQCTLLDPAKGIFALVDEIERGTDKDGAPSGSHNQGIVSLTHTPGFPPADIKECGPAIVVYGHDKAATEAAADRLQAAINAKESAFAGEIPVEAAWRVVRIGDGVFTGTGPFYGGAKFQIGPMALVTDEASGVSAVLACKRVQAADQEMFRHVGVEPSKVPILALKST